MNKIITMTAYRRPEYTRRVLEALAKCEGFDRWTLMIQVDPSEQMEAVTDVICLLNPPCFKTENYERLGLNQNTHRVLSRAAALMTARDFVLHLEDDTVPAPDALLWYEWALHRYRDDPQIFTVSGYNKLPALPEPKDYRFASKRSWFTCWGWATWGDRLGQMLNNWSFDNPKSFAWHQNKSTRGQRLEVYPVLSRIQNIGYQDGENGRSPEWYEAHHRTPVWAGDVPAELLTADWQAA